VAEGHYAAFSLYGCTRPRPNDAKCPNARAVASQAKGRERRLRGLMHPWLTSPRTPGASRQRPRLWHHRSPWLSREPPPPTTWARRGLAWGGTQTTLWIAAALYDRPPNEAHAEGCPCEQEHGRL